MGPTLTAVIFKFYFALLVLLTTLTFCTIRRPMWCFKLRHISFDKRILILMSRSDISYVNCGDRRDRLADRRRQSISCLAASWLGAVLTDACVRDAVYMDQSEDCDRALTQTQDLVEGDLYLVKSDVYGGKATSQRQPAECSVAFNFGGRRLAVAVVDWTCEQPYREPMLAIYADCDRQRRSKPLVCIVHLQLHSTLSNQIRPRFFVSL